MSRKHVNQLLDLALHAAGLGATLVGLVVLCTLLFDIFSDGLGRLSWDFLINFPSRRAENAGIYAALAGTVWVMTLTAGLAVPIGVAAAIYLEEYGTGGRWSRLIEINIANLAGVPSVIYGLLGLGLFVRTLAFGRSVLAGAITKGGILRARGYEVADRLASGLASRVSRNPHRDDPRLVTRHRGNGSFDRNWGIDICAICARRNLVAIHGAADSGIQLGIPSAGGVPRERRRRYHCDSRLVAGDERRSCLATGPISTLTGRTCVSLGH